MKTIASGLWPSAARAACDAHNRKHHWSIPRAYICVDAMSDKEFLPTYEVRCPACPAEEQGRLEEEEE